MTTDTRRRDAWIEDFGKVSQSASDFYQVQQRLRRRFSRPESVLRAIKWSIGETYMSSRLERGERVTWDEAAAVWLESMGATAPTPERGYRRKVRSYVQRTSEPVKPKTQEHIADEVFAALESEGNGDPRNTLHGIANGLSDFAHCADADPRLADLLRSVARQVEGAIVAWIGEARRREQG